ncbi:L,D-transpeptidase [Bauldia sp.]|uniref:L,D-transpeptidase n=1 Tax=Bauldia sp. TaxID=2575872 RepID=UPI0025C4500F|nr:L,D-transpeptidase [Bauldia sp.]
MSILRRVAVAGMVLLSTMVFASVASAGIVVSIDKSAQRMTVTVDGVKKYYWPVSTGARGYTTPSGTFQPFRMEEEHFSEEWDDAPMPNSVFFTQQGHAIHGSLATRNLGRPVSHGCVRLSPANAKTLYNLIEKRGIYSTKIIIQDRGSAKVATNASAGKKSGKKSKTKMSPLWKLYD